ncbi:ion transporter [Aureimonas sp. SA4125]|nr:ion transporter [Aureimonas sp. SA4125]
MTSFETLGERTPDDRSPGARQKPLAPPRQSFLSGFLARLKPRVPAMLRQDLTDALQGTGDGVFSTEERAMLNNILRLREVRVEDVMVPRADVEAVEITATLGQLMREFEASGHSRMPVYGEDLDDPRGMIHLRDVLAHITRCAQTGNPAPAAPGSAVTQGAAADAPLDLGHIDLDRSIEDLGLLRDVLFVPPSMLASNLMARMQATRTQMALVIDEYGGTDGLVSLEDIIEMVVGNIEDEHDDEAAMIVARGDGNYVADARADLDHVRTMIGDDFDFSDYEEEAETVGGLLFSRLGRVPAQGEVIEAVKGFEFHVLAADPRRVLRVRILRLAQGDAMADGTALS